MQRILIIAGAVAAGVLLILANALYIVPVDQQAIVLRFGEAQYTVNATEPGMTAKGPMQNAPAGLHFKTPLLDDVKYFDKRNMGYDLEADEIIAADQQRLNVDAIARYRIKNPLQLFRAAGTEALGATQLGFRFTSALRAELGKVSQPDIISAQRTALMGRVRTNLQAEVNTLGLEIIDVRIRKADLPQANSERVYERMKSQLKQKVSQYNAEGEGLYASITGEANKQVQVITAEAEQKSQVLMGEGDAERNRIYASAYNKDAEFFAFYRSLEAYKVSIKAGTPLVISPDSEFFKYFRSMGGGR